jgi:hypothetical protein
MWRTLPQRKLYVRAKQSKARRFHCVVRITLTNCTFICVSAFCMCWMPRDILGVRLSLPPIRPHAQNLLFGPERIA